MVWMDNANRLCLLTMMTLGCPGGDDGSASDDDGGTTQGTTADSDGDTVGNPVTSADTTAATSADTTDAQSTAGDTTAGDTTAGDSTAGDTTAGDTTAGDTTAGDTTAGDTTQGSSGTDTSSGGGSEESTTSVEPVSPFVQACVASYTNYDDCYGLGYSEEELVQLCTDYEGYFEMYYVDEACLNAQIDVFACISELTCMELMDFTTGEGGCADEMLAGNEVCPELFPFCGFGGVGGGPDGCMVEAGACLDGSDYGVECDAMTCTCTVDGVAGVTFNSTGADVCFEDDFGDTVTMLCGFPEGIFF